MLIAIIKVLLILLTIYIFEEILRANLTDRTTDRITARSTILLGLSQILTWFLATFGVSDTAVNLVVYKKSKLVDTRRLAPTIVTGALIPLAIMSYSYLSKVIVDPTTVVIIVVCQCLGGFAGAVLVKKLKIRTIRTIMGNALIVAAIFLFARIFFLRMEGGSLTGLTGWRLIVAALLIMFMQALVMLGFANTVPSMCLLLMLGMSPVAVYPLVMTGEFFGCAAGCIKVLKDKNYNRRIALIEAICGTIGVIAAVNLVAGMNLVILQCLMILLMLYCAITMFRENKTGERKQE